MKAQDASSGTPLYLPSAMSKPSFARNRAPLGKPFGAPISSIATIPFGGSPAQEREKTPLTPFKAYGGLPAASSSEVPDYSQIGKPLGNRRIIQPDSYQQQFHM